MVKKFIDIEPDNSLRNILPYLPYFGNHVWVASQEEDVPDEYLHYFERTVIGISRGRRSTKRRSNPLFSVCEQSSKKENKIPRNNVASNRGPVMMLPTRKLNV